MKAHNTPSKYILLDTSVLVGYYIPESISAPAHDKIRIILESCRTGMQPDWYLMIPNIVIAEVFSTFAKYCFATWNQQVKRNLPNGLDKRRYNTIRRLFHEHIHNGHFFHQIELNRYHILGIDLIAPIDHYFEHFRGKKNKRPMQTADMLILSMGIYLNHQFGHDKFMILTADRRMSAICEKARLGINESTIDKLDIRKKANELGYGYSSTIFPKIVNLAKRGKQYLKDCFGEWPLPIAKRSKTKIKGPY